MRYISPNPISFAIKNILKLKPLLNKTNNRVIFPIRAFANSTPIPPVVPPMPTLKPQDVVNGETEQIPDLKTAFNNLYEVMNESALPDSQMYEQCKREIENNINTLNTKYLF